jgi:16S rRNA (adenine1518-N6/adenine1519-N6)-dimethyltransferase
MIPIQNPAEVDEETFHQVVAASFAMRRKTLKNNLAKWISPEMMEEAGIKPEQRAESVPLENSPGSLSSCSGHFNRAARPSSA